MENDDSTSSMQERVDTQVRYILQCLPDNHEQWPEKCELYQPLPSQILLYDLASSESVNALFKISDIECVLMKVKNAEYMSTNGKLPLVRRGTRILCGFEEVATYLHSQTKTATKQQKVPLENFNPRILDAESRAYIDWIESNFLKAEMFSCWCQKQTLQEYTFPRYTFKLAWPLNHILFWLKKLEMQKKFTDEKSTILSDFESFLDKLESDLVQRRNFNPSDEKSWTAADALIAGHVKAIKTDSGFFSLDELVSRHKTICVIMESVTKKEVKTSKAN